mmetsp:Transcript_30616/g.46983  ORF Transcript_30616/g.46983 Transcript_30616/m.46983 type:complete len:204 (-) Transcript_30616:57-668(-)|eukprot:CAMPEP_0195295244 /NCGR_PEP_ID=MMETSP0707-20130614/16942_1 /TAXON_ID=33640 /ORGANISM="Asterionellopsis glacialis, Strain CCMP134" /LENGTH=203 /DNA_ID=CAMNT_0040356421 /DNA_START=41 /DNA_END=652 /DNA_ORIENTATION=-
MPLITNKSFNVCHRQRKVRFNEVVVVVPIPCAISEDLSPATLWYQKSELSRFKSSTLELSIRFINKSDSPTSLLESARKYDDDDNVCTRGLEFGSSVDRQQHRTLAIRAVLDMISRYQDPEKLALMSMKCTARARQIANITGLQDFYSTYHPSRVVPKVKLIPFPIKTRPRRKRKDPAPIKILDTNPQILHKVIPCKQQKLMP